MYILSNDWEVNFDMERRCGIWTKKRKVVESKQVKINNLWGSDCRETLIPEFFQVDQLNILRNKII